MLAQAQRLRAQGLDVVIGVVETHGRKETAALLDGLTILPPKRHSHRGGKSANLTGCRPRPASGADFNG